MDNFFLSLYKKFNKMGLDGRDLDSMLNSLPWKLKELKDDGTGVYECSIAEEPLIKTNAHLKNKKLYKRALEINISSSTDIER